ncbi:hypothetical protein BDF21DRAFT_408353 [Thamnidium elegans]|nr:hypothetical protein BDF21DRAFT_408353 [Thamnidium elegans]
MASTLSKQIKNLPGVDISSDNYSVAPNEWADGSRSDMVYASTKPPPPILIKVQYQVNQEFMLRLISYASNVYRRYKALPIVLVGTSPFTPPVSIYDVFFFGAPPFTITGSLYVKTT